jgi:hypothetical protein
VPSPPLTVQISNIPRSANNHHTISVTVQSIPGATVWLTIITGANPPYITTGKKSTNSNGNAVINWQIDETTFSYFSQKTTARVTAVASGQNGQQVQSQPANVTINLAG